MKFRVLLIVLTVVLYQNTFLVKPVYANTPSPPPTIHLTTTSPFTSASPTISLTPAPTSTPVSSQDSNAPTIVDYITALGAIATPIVVLALTGLGWSIRNRIEKTHELEEKLRDERIRVYDAILEPFIILLTNEEGLPNSKEYRGKTKSEVAIKKAMSLEYRQSAFRLSLMGSDEVLRAYNNLMQFFFNQKPSVEEPQTENSTPKEETTKEMLELFGILLFEIRKSVGNEKSGLHHFEMLEFLITDIRKYQKNGQY